MESAEKAAAGWVRALDLSKFVAGAPRIYAGEERFSAGNAKGSFSVAPPGRAERWIPNIFGWQSETRLGAPQSKRQPSPAESVWELENRPRIGPRPGGPVAKHQPSPEGLGNPAG